MRQLRIFSYLPNPRIWKATIAARLADVDIEVRGASPKELGSWLWDFDAHPITSGEKAGSGEVPGHAGFKGQLHKTEAFLDAHPFGTVPAAFSPDGSVLRVNGFQAGQQQKAEQPAESERDRALPVRINVLSIHLHLGAVMGHTFDHRSHFRGRW